MTTPDASLFIRDTDGIQIRTSGIPRSVDEYSDEMFMILLGIQETHFWHKGRHRFMNYALRRHLPLIPRPVDQLHVIDLGAGCGGWIRFLGNQPSYGFRELAMGDSYRKPLELAGDIVGTGIERYHVDLYDMGWTEQWDVVFLMDVIEHIEDDADVLRRVHTIMKPGGLLFVTVPALQFFWSRNDDVTGHRRRYSRQDLRSLAQTSGFSLLFSRYFMFFLSPIYFLQRFFGPKYRGMTRKEIEEKIAQVYKSPSRPVNTILGAVFALETPLGHWIPFPWGTSVMGVFQKKTGDG